MKKIKKTNKRRKRISKRTKKNKVCIIGNKMPSPRNYSNKIRKRKELQNAKEYLDEIYIYLKKIEKDNLPLENYISLNNQTLMRRCG